MKGTPLIRSVRLAGVGPFSAEGPQSKREIPLERLTLFVGPNSSGKSTILRAVGWLCDLATRESGWNLEMLSKKLQPLVNRRSDELSIGFESENRDEPFDLSLRCMRNRDTLDIIVRLDTRDGSSGFAFGPDRASFESTFTHGRFAADSSSPARRWRQWGQLSAHASLMRAARLCLDPDRIAAPSYFPGDTPTILPDGTYCASVLVELSLAARDRFDAVCDAIRHIIPDLLAIKFRREQSIQGENNVWGHQLVLDMTSGEGIPAPAASEGTLLVIGLVTLLMGSQDPPNILLIDDIDRALHPRAQAELMKLLRRLMDERPQLQILATSHSPYLLDHVDASEVRVTSVDHATGEAVCASLTEHADFEEWREMMSPGEFWSAVGEDWVLGAQRGDG